MRTLTLSLVVALGSPALAATLTPYQNVSVGGPNNLIDISHEACSETRGCYQADGTLCNATHDPNHPEICHVVRVPAGRCASGGNASCRWPQGGGFCAEVGNPSLPRNADLLPACLPDDPNDHGATGVGFASSMCPTGSTCNMTSNDAACACQGSDPAAADWEGTVCGSGPDDTQARCSDGDEDAGFGGLGTGLCTNMSVDDDPGQARFSNCGSESVQNGALSGPRYSAENWPGVVTAQRTPGTGLARPEVPILRARTTFVTEIDDVGPIIEGYFGQWGIRRLVTHSESYFADSVFGAGSTHGSGLDNTITTWPCDPPLFWASNYPVAGLCLDDPNTGLNEANFGCIRDFHCALVGSSLGCDPDTMLFCHELGRNPQGFLFTRDLDPNQIAAAGSTGVCPPDCRTMPDFHTFEQEAIVKAGADSGDFRASIQLALDNLEGPRAGRGDLLLVSAATSITWLDPDPRCFFGGNPDIVTATSCIPSSDPNDAASTTCGGLATKNGGAACTNVADCPDKVGRCGLSARTCNPQNDPSLPTECGGGTCVYCGGTRDTAYTGNPAAFVHPRGNAQALPVGYDSLGFSDLELLDPNTGVNVHRRIFVLPDVPAIVRTPLFFMSTNAGARAEFRDNDVQGINDMVFLGEVSGGTAGIGNGGSKPAGSTIDFDPGGPGLGGSFSWSHEYPGTPVTSLQEAPDWGPGANGIPGCVGDNSTHAGSGAPPCDQLLGGLIPVSTGTDDEPILMDFSVDGSGDHRPAAIARYKMSDPFAEAPILHTTSAQAVRDIDLGGIGTLVTNLDFLAKTNLTSCPIVDGAADCSAWNQRICHERGGYDPATGLCNNDAGEHWDWDGDGFSDFVDLCKYWPGLTNIPGPGAGTDDIDGNFRGNDCECGDQTGDGTVNLDDIFAINAVILAGGAGAAPLCDTNNDGACNLNDLFGVNSKIVGGLQDLTCSRQPYPW